MKNDVVNHPSHYTDGKIEVIDFIDDKKLGFCLGNAVKYISRAGKKDPTKEIEDLEKAIWYINHHIKNLQSKQQTLGNSKEIVDEFEKNTEIKPVKDLPIRIFNDTNPTVEFSSDMPEDQICDGLFKIFHAADPEYSREQFDEDWKDLKEEATRELPTLMDFSRLFK